MNKLPCLKFHRRNGKLTRKREHGRTLFSGGVTKEVKTVIHHWAVADGAIYAITVVTEMVNGEFKTYIEVFEVLDAPTIIESEGVDA